MVVAAKGWLPTLRESSTAQLRLFCFHHAGGSPSIYRDWSAHLPKLTSFWCRALLSQPGYEGNPYRQHALVHAKSPFDHRHFERWLELFEETVRLGWTGPRAEHALELAHRVADVHERALVSGKRVWMPVAVAGD